MARGNIYVYIVTMSSPGRAGVDAAHGPSDRDADLGRQAAHHSRLHPAHTSRHQVRAVALLSTLSSPRYTSLPKKNYEWESAPAHEVPMISSVNVPMNSTS